MMTPTREIITLPSGEKLRVVDRQIVRGSFAVAETVNGKRVESRKEYAYTAVRCERAS